MSQLPDDGFSNLTPEQKMSLLFRNMVVERANTALMLLGRIPHPETGEVIQDLEAAQFFIDQLAMIAIKTKGNLDAEEAELMHKSLTLLRMAFVETSGQIPTGPDPLDALQDPGGASGSSGLFTPGSSAAPAPAPVATPPLEPPVREEKPAAAPPVEDTESRKKFSKKY